MPRYSRSRSRTPPRRRRRRSYSSSVSSRSRSGSRSPLRGNPKYHSHSRKTTRGRSYSRSPPRKGQGRRTSGSGYKSSSSKHRNRRSRSYSPEKRHYSGSASTGRSRSRSPRRNERYKSPKRSPQQDGQGASHPSNFRQDEQSYLTQKNQSDNRAGYQESQIRDAEGPQLPPGHSLFRDDYGKGVQAQEQLPFTSREVAYDRAGGQPGSTQSNYGPSHGQPVERPYAKDSYREKEKTKYEAVSPEDLHFTSKTPPRSQSPFDRKISKIKSEPQPSYYQVQEKYIQGQGDASSQSFKPGVPQEPQKVKMAPVPIIRPIFDPYSVKIPRRKDEGLKEIFDRPELKARFAQEQMQPQGAPETQFVSTTEKKEQVVYRQDVHFTDTLPGGGLPLQSHGFIERREPLIMDFEPRRDAYPDPNVQYGPRVVSPMGVGGQYPGQPSSFQGQPSDQFGPVKDIQHIADFSRQATFIHEASPIISAPHPPQSPTSYQYQYPPDDLPNIKGPHDLRHDLESRRKQMEQQQQQGQMRSLSKSRSRSRSRRMSPSARPRSISRSRSRSPMQHYNKSSSYQSRSRERSEDQRSGDRRPIQERLGNVSKRRRDDSASDGDGDGSSFRWKQKQPQFYYHDNRKENRSTSRDRDQRDHDNNYRGRGTKYRGTVRGTFRGGRTRGYLGKNYIPGYNSRLYSNRGMRGRYQPRGGRGFTGSRRSPTSTWTHDLFDKDKDWHSGDEEEEKKKKKKQKNDKDGKEKKSVKQKSKTVKKIKKSKKSPSRSESSQTNKDKPQAPVTTESTSLA